MHDPGAAVALSVHGAVSHIAVEVDVELATPATSLPAPLWRIAAADQAIPAGVFAFGGVLVAPLVAVLGLQPRSELPALAVLGPLLGPAAAAVAALSATGKSPSPFLSSGVAAAIRLRGLIASILLMGIVTIVRQPPLVRGVLPWQPSTAAAISVVALFDVTLVALSLWTAKSALLNAR